MSRPTDKADRYLNYGLTNRLFKSQEEYLERKEIGGDNHQKGELFKVPSVIILSSPGTGEYGYSLFPTSLFPFPIP